MIGMARLRRGQRLRRRACSPSAPACRSTQIARARRGADRHAGRRRLGHPRRRRDVSPFRRPRPTAVRRSRPAAATRIARACSTASRNGWDWERTGRLASLLGSIKIASRGGQNHALSTRDAWRRCTARTFGTRSLVSDAADAAVPSSAHAIRWSSRAIGATRTCVHVLAGVATTMFVFPFVSDARKRSARQALERAAPAHPERRGARARRARRASAATCCSSPITSRGSTSSCSTRTSPCASSRSRRSRAGPCCRSMIRGAGTIFIERERRRDTQRVNRDMARRARQRRRRRDLSRRHDDATARACCRSRARCCSRSSRRAGTCSRWRSAIARRTGELAMAPTYVGDTIVRDVVLARVRRARARRWS